RPKLVWTSSARRGSDNQYSATRPTDLTTSVMSSALSPLILPSSRGFRYAASALPPSSTRRAMLCDRASTSTLPTVAVSVVGLSILVHLQTEVARTGSSCKQRLSAWLRRACHGETPTLL